MTTLPERDSGLVKIIEVETYFNVSTSTVYLWIAHGKLTVKRRPSGTIQGVYRDSVLRWEPTVRNKSILVD